MSNTTLARGGWPDKTTGLDRKIETYEKIYPAGQGREIIERTCMVCHGPNFLPSMPQDRDTWGSMVDFMTTGTPSGFQRTVHAIC